MATSLSSILLVVLGTFVGAFGALFLKLGASDSLSLKSLFINIRVLLGLALYAISAIIFVAALPGGEVSVLYPFVSAGYIWIAILSVYFLRERMNAMKWLGIASIVLGVMLIGFGS